MDVVISGIGGRFPCSKNIKEFSDHLLAGKSLLEPARRWSPGALDTPKLFGHTDSFSQFDYTFFGVHYDLARSSDPMTRLAMETAFEAVIDAGICPTTLRGTNAQVYTASVQMEGDCVFNEFYRGLGYVIMGRNRCMSANRISYCLGLTGRSTAYDASIGWIGTGLALAREAILSGECDTVFVNGFSMMVLQEINKHKQYLGLLSPDSSVHPYDVDINGCARGEAQITFLIQRADIAKRSYGSIVAAGAESQGSLPNWFLTVNEDHLEDFVTSLYEENGLDPNNVKLLEADGLCIKDMVEPELNVLDKVLNSHRRQDSPLYLGTVKSLVGGLEGSDGHTSLTKLILAMETGVISPTLDCGRLNPNISGLVNNRYKVVTEPTAWEVTPDTLVALSSLTTNGVVSHVVLRANGKAKDPNVKKDYPLPYLVLLSGRTPEIVEKSLKDVTSSPFDPEYLRLTQEVFARTISKFDWKGYGFHGQDEAEKFVVQRENRRPVWFAYSGMGSQWPTMGQHLLDFPIVKETLERLHKTLEPKGIDLMNIMTTPDETIFENILYSFVGIASIQIALTNLLNQLGINCDGLIGHSVGELGCSYADGCLTEEQTVLAAYERGMASLKAELIPGLMAAVGLGYKEAKDILPPDVFVACHNSKDSCTISGPTESVQNVISSLNAKDIFVRGVNVSNIAYHSPYIRPAAPYLRDALLKVIPSPKLRSSKWICTSAPKEKWDTDEVRYCSADYHTNNLLSPVLFEEGSAHIPKNAILIEIAPHGLLQAILKRSLSKDIVNIALTRRNAAEPAKLLLEAIGKLYMEGCSPQIWHLYPDVSMPVSRNTPSLTPLLEWDHSEVFPTLSNPEPITKELVHSLKTSSPHVEINGVKCLLPSYALLMVWKRFSEFHRVSFSDISVVFEDVRFFDVIRLEEEGVINLGMVFLTTTGMFDITRNEVLVAQGRIRAWDEFKDIPVNLPAFSDVVELSLDSNDVYVEMKNRCVGVPKNLKTIKSLQVRPEGWTAEISFDEDWITLLNSLFTIFQIQSCERDQVTVFLSRILSLTINLAKKEDYDSTARLHLPSKTLTYKGVTLSQLTFQPIKNPKPRSEPLSLQFVPYGQTDLEETDRFLYHVVQLCLERRCDITSTVKIYDAVGKCPSLISKLSDILKTEFCTKCEILRGAKDANLVVCGSDFFEDSTKPIFTDTNCLFLIRRGNDFSKYINKSSLKGGLEIIAESEARERANALVVLSKELPPFQSADCKILKMKPQDELDSVKDSDHKLIILVWENGTCKPIERFIVETLAMGVSEKIRLVILMTPNSPSFSMSLPMYANQIRLNLSVNIYLNGTWGSYRLLPVLERRLCNGTTNVWPVRSKKVEISFSDSSLYVAAKTKSLCSDEIVGYAVEYKNDDRMMGVGRCLDRSSQYLLPDPHLKWPIPRSWNLKDAAAVPNAFATAYYALIQEAQLQSKESVLISCPLTPVGQAALSIANSLGCETLALLKSPEEERQFQKMPWVKSRHIIVSKIKDALYSIKKIVPKGVDVILSDFSGKEGRILTQMVTFFGSRWIQIGEDAMHNADKIGLSLFLYSVCMSGVTQQLLLKTTAEKKKKIVKWIEEGLENGVVVPFSFPMECSPITDGFRTHNGVNPKTYNKSGKEEMGTLTDSLESQKHKCLIVGGSPAQWIRLAYCLARKCYKHIALVPGKQSPNLIIRHSRILRTEFAAELSELESISPSQISEIGFIKDIFIFDRTSFAEDVSRLLDLRSLGDTRVTFFSGGSTEFSRKCERWSRDGLKVKAALGVEDVPIDTAGPYLDYILSPAAPAVSVLNLSFFSAVNSQVKSLSETGFLPTSAAELQSLGASIRRSSLLIFRKLVTLNSVKRSCEINPVFFIKGVHGSATSDVTTLGAGLFAPLFEVTLPGDCGSLEAVARDVVQGVQKIQSYGPYTLAGDPIRSDVVLRVAKILEDNGFACVVFVVAEEIEATLMLLQKEKRLGESIIKFSIGEDVDPQEWKTVNWSSLTWAEQVQVAVSKIPCSDSNMCEDITAALHHIYNSVLHVIGTKEKVTLNHGIVHLLKEGDESQNYQTRDRHYVHSLPSSKPTPTEFAEIISPHLATPSLQLELDRARRTGLI